jgi:hypothetical protein
MVPGSDVGPGIPTSLNASNKVLDMDPLLAYTIIAGFHPDAQPENPGPTQNGNQKTP